MYAKIFTQIFDSSIAENYEVRHVFEDLLKLADRAGAVDMTVEAISRRTNVPLEKVQMAITELMKPDERSRSKEYEGRRLIPLDEARDWGWMIVNYEHYRAIQDEESRRETWRISKAKQRAKFAQISARKKQRIKNVKAKIAAKEAIQEEVRARHNSKYSSQEIADLPTAKEFPRPCDRG